MQKCSANHYRAISTFRAPYTAIIQSSGMGKSRLLSELASRVPMVYVSFASPNGHGFPKRTDTLARLFRSGAASTDELEQNLCHIFTASIRSLSTHDFDSKAFFNNQHITDPNGSSSAWFINYFEIGFDVDKVSLTAAQEMLIDEAQSN